ITRLARDGTAKPGSRFQILRTLLVANEWYGLRREMEEISRDFWVRYGYVWQSH
ncbi:unnamed protein product, partial [Ascophyllum nodosum]